MRYRLLGTLEVIDDTGNTIDLGPFKQRSLFALLLLNSGQVISTDRILEELWGEDADGKQNALWVYVSRLRSALDPERSDRSESSILVRRDPGYVLDIDRSEIDVHVFEDALRAARLIAVDDPEAAVTQLQTARSTIKMLRPTAVDTLPEIPDEISQQVHALMGPRVQITGQ